MYYVYILASRTLVLYIGVTNDLARRIAEHKLKVIPGFTSKYSVDRLLYYEMFNTPTEAIAREKQLKGWKRVRKIELIKTMNPSMEEVIFK